MPVLIDGVIADNVTDFNKLFRGSNNVKISNEFLKSHQVVVVDENQYALYVAQKEFAVVTPEPDAPEIIGTDESTTCHIILCKHSGSGVCCLAHMDGSYTEDGIHRMLDKLKQLSIGGPEGRYELHVVGGFIDKKKYSKRLSSQIINCLLSSEEDLHLMTYCVYDENDVIRNSIHFPIITGLAINMRTHQIFPVEFTFKGPDSDIRSASGFALREKMRNIYLNKCLVVGPFDWSISCCADVDALDENFIRKNFSTSPEQESKYFVDHIKSSFRILKNHPESMKTLFPNGLARKYKWNSSNLNWENCN